MKSKELISGGVFTRVQDFAPCCETIQKDIGIYPFRMVGSKPVRIPGGTSDPEVRYSSYVDDCDWAIDGGLDKNSVFSVMFGLGDMTGAQIKQISAIMMWRFPLSGNDRDFTSMALFLKEDEDHLLHYLKAFGADTISGKDKPIYYKLSIGTVAGAISCWTVLLKEFKDGGYTGRYVRVDDNLFFNAEEAERVQQSFGKDGELQ